MREATSRRKFLRRSAVLALAASAPSAAQSRADEEPPRVMTVRGPIDPSEMGPTLPHEHILVDFIGAERVSPDRYDTVEVVRVALPHLVAAAGQGIRTLVECTPAYLGRDPALLRHLSERSGLHIITNTGYYGANDHRHLPAHAFTDTADGLAARWLREWHEGIGGTGIRPGLIKIGVGRGSLPEVDRRLVRSAARTHRASGLTIASHTGDGAAAMEELAIVEDEGVDPSAFIWVHAQNEEDSRTHARAAERGAWVEFDGIGPDSIDRHLALVREMKDRGHLDRVLLSHDAGWYHVGEPGGGTFRPFDTLTAAFLPRLRDAGFTDAECQRLTVDNPREAFTIRIRGGTRPAPTTLPSDQSLEDQVSDLGHLNRRAVSGRGAVADEQRAIVFGRGREPVAAADQGRVEGYDVEERAEPELLLD